MSNYNCVMKRIGDVVKVKTYGKNIPSNRAAWRKTKAERLMEIGEIQSSPTLSDMEKLVQTAVLNDVGKELAMKRIPRRLTFAEIERFSDLMDMNFSIGHKFITLTYGKEHMPLDEASNDFENWIKRMRERYCDFKYLGVRSFQERSTLHFHLLADLPSIPKVELSRGTFRNIWGHGNVDIQSIYNMPISYRRNKLQNYLIQNLREFKEDERSFNKRLYLQSKNLELPEAIRGNYDELMEVLFDEGYILLDSYRFRVEYLQFIELQTYGLMGHRANLNFKEIALRGL